MASKYTTVVVLVFFGCYWLKKEVNSDLMHKVTRGLRERSQNSHCATTRVIRKKRHPLLNRGLQSTVPASRNEPEASEVLHLPHGVIIMSKNQKCWRRQFQPHGWKSVGCLAPVTQRNVLDFKMSRMSHTPREMDRAQKKRARHASKTSFGKEQNGTTVLREPAESKCPWTSHKGTCVRKFAVQKPGARWSTLI